MIDEETNNLIAKFYLSRIHFEKVEARDFSDWAISKLEHGSDTKNIRILASMCNADVFLEVEDHFNRALAELNWTFPSREECMKRYTEFIANEILAGNLAPSEGCEMLYDINNYLDHPAYLSNWVGVYWSGEELTARKYNELISEEAQRLLDGVIPQPGEFYHSKFSVQPHTETDNFFVRFWRRFFG